MTVKVMFVCMGNICRSPTAHGVFRAAVTAAGLSDQIYIESSGTHAYHVGESPDRRAQQTARSRGLDMSDLRAQKVRSSDFDTFDYVLAMDDDNMFNLQAICPPEHKSKLYMFLDFAHNTAGREVPDPYYGGASGFETVFDMVEDGSQGLLQHIRKTHQV